MTAPWIHIYNKPKQAVTQDRFISRHIAYDYRHKISAIGGFDTAECTIKLDQSAAEIVFSEQVGNRVFIYMDNPIEPIWEGIINRVSIQAGAIALTRSLDEMSNRVTTVYTDTSGSPNDQVTAEVTNTDSIAIFGSKMGTLEAGAQYSTGSSIAEALRDKALEQQAWPQISRTNNQLNATVKIQMIGFYHTFKWDSFAVATTTTINVGVGIKAYTSSVPATTFVGYNSSNTAGNGDGLFYDDTDDSMIDANTSFNVTYEKRNGQNTWDLIAQWCDGGDAANDWVIGITPTRHSTGTRLFYYRQANAVVEYFVDVFRGDQIFNIRGYHVNNWDVRPDRIIRLRDVLPFYNKAGDDPRLAYIQTVEWDAESDKITWTSKDDIRFEGVMQLNRPVKLHGTRFGANKRVTYN